MRRWLWGVEVFCEAEVSEEGGGFNDTHRGSGMRHDMQNFSKSSFAFI